MDAKRLSKIMYEAFVEAGFSLEALDETSSLFHVPVDMPEHILSIVSLRGSRHGMLVFGFVDLEFLHKRHGSSERDIAYALSQVSLDQASQGISIDIRDGAVVIHTMVKPGLFFSKKAMYRETYDAMLDVRVTASLLDDQLKFMMRHSEMFERLLSSENGTALF